MRVEHPSNRLYRGEITDFSDACRVAVAQYEIERAAALGGSGDPEDPDGSKLVAIMDEGIREAREAAAIYQHGIAEAEEHITESLRAAGLPQYADALMRHDYSCLAI